MAFPVVLLRRVALDGDAEGGEELVDEAGVLEGVELEELGGASLGLPEAGVLDEDGNEREEGRDVGQEVPCLAGVAFDLCDGPVGVVDGLVDEGVAGGRGGVFREGSVVVEDRRADRAGVDDQDFVLGVVARPSGRGHCLTPG